MLKKYKLIKTIQSILIVVSVIFFLLALDNTNKTWNTICMYISAISITLALFNYIILCIYKKKVQNKLEEEQLKYFENKNKDKNV